MALFWVGNSKSPKTPHIYASNVTDPSNLLIVHRVSEPHVKLKPLKAVLVRDYPVARESPDYNNCIRGS
jgi:hypothetical protein